MNLDQVRVLYTDVLKNVQKVIVGQEEVFTLLFTAVLARGHVLLEDTPGTGKTSLAKAFAKSVSGTFHRVQFTPDLLPQDITGLSIYNQKEQEFRLMKGPVFANLLLADEIAVLMGNADLRKMSNIQIVKTYLTEIYDKYHENP